MVGRVHKDWFHYTSFECAVCMEEHGRLGGGGSLGYLLNMHSEITSEANLRQTTSNEGSYE